MFLTKDSTTTTTSLTATSKAVPVTDGEKYNWVRVICPDAIVHLSTKDPADTADKPFAQGTVDYFPSNGAVELYAKTKAGATDILVTPGVWSE